MLYVKEKPVEDDNSVEDGIEDGNPQFEILVRFDQDTLWTPRVDLGAGDFEGIDVLFAFEDGHFSWMQKIKGEMLFSCSVYVSHKYPRLFVPA
jgi:hypothetical protein